MPNKKQYGDAYSYEAKLKKVMERLKIKEYNYNWDRFGSWVEFRYKGELYRFDHSVQNARNHGVDLQYGSDTFAQLILALEDIARMTERGIYELQTWVAGMKFLPPAIEIPSFFKILGFKELPSDLSEIDTRYRNLAKQLHPDNGGTKDDFINLKEATEKCKKYLTEK